MRAIEHIEAEAGAKLARDQVAQRDGGGGKKLSYVEAHYVIQRMNEVFGPMGWDSETVEMRQVNKDDAKPAYVAKVRVTALVKTGEGFMKTVKEGFGFGSDKSGLNPHEMAVKEAESDAFKRAARQFGMSLGLALYDKSQENVEDAPLVVPTSRKPETPPVAGSAPPASKTTKETLSAQIVTKVRVAIAKGKYTKESWGAFLQEKYGVKYSDELDDAKSNELHAHLQEVIK